MHVFRAQTTPSYNNHAGKLMRFMRFVIATAAAVSLGVLSLAQADPPGTTSNGASPPAPATSTSTSEPAPAATSAAPATSADATQSAAPSKDAKPTVVVQGTPEYDSLKKHFLSEGYKLEMHNGDEMFCRREQQLGSRLPGPKTCATAQELMFAEREGQRSVDRNMMQQNNPSGR